MYLENRITNQSKVSKFANKRDNKTSEAKPKGLERKTNDQSSVTLDAKGLEAGHCRPLLSYWLSKKERRVDALALRADERRDKLRKAAGSCT